MNADNDRARPGRPPLAGRRVVVTRAAAQAGDLLAMLEAAGAEAIALPAISIVPPEDPEPLKRAARAAAAEGYDGYIFTSQNAVVAFFDAAEKLGLRLAQPHGWICAIGPATAAALRARGWAPGIVPAEFVAESLVAALADRALRGQRILLPRAMAARNVIPQALGERGARVEAVAAYRTVVPEGAAEQARELFPAAPGASRPGAVLFTSSSTARHLAEMLGADYRRRLRGVLLAAIGPVTAATLTELGLAAGVTAREFTASGLCAALAAHFAAH